MTTRPAPRDVAPAWKDGTGEYAAGVAESAAVFDGKRYVDVGNVANFGFFDSFTLAAWIYPAAPPEPSISRAQDEVEGQGFGLYLKDGHLAGQYGAALAG